MSAPHTNMETQKRRHRGPLIGMALVVIFGVALIVYWQFEEAAQGNSPTPDTVEADTGTEPAATPVAEE
ncbi:MAG: hypothetical protein U1E69_17475 [Tabrizicola sp.]|uniref:hypothetical protein n=1 Tax=Tabrizicola sp. TaxID=2005166 RepID=UPI002AB9DD27|nr:hypothetical protein [Tabrizicola sp.]MDZ4088583.1 hypothetical protein [Tabrizicola sp.]